MVLKNNDKWKSWTKKWIWINAFLILAFLTVTISILHIFREDYSDEEIISHYPNILYGSAITESSNIKFKIIKEKKPNVVAIGSSRVMQFRSMYFKNNDFYTMGGTASSLDEAQYTFDKISKICKPSIVILGVDLWWLNPNFKQQNRYRNQEEEQNINTQKYFDLWVNLKDNGKLREALLNYTDIKEKEEYGNRDTVGLSSAVKSEGYRLDDGSYQYGEIIKKKESTDIKFKDTHNRILKGNARFQWADDIDYEQLDKLKYLIRDMKQNNVHVMVLLPPFPDEIYNTMYNSEKYHTFIDKFEESIQTLCISENVSYYNCGNLSWIGASDNETIDGFHGSDLAYARIVKKMTDDNYFSEYVDEELLDHLIKNPISCLQIAL